MLILILRLVPLFLAQSVEHDNKRQADGQGGDRQRDKSLMRHNGFLCVNKL